MSSNYRGTFIVGPAPADNPSANLDRFAAQVEAKFGYKEDNKCSAAVTEMAERIYSWLKMEYYPGGALQMDVVRKLFLAMAENPSRFVNMRDL